MSLGATGVTDGIVGDVGLVLALPGLVAHTATVTTFQALRYLVNTQVNSALHWLNIVVCLNKRYIEGKPGLLFEAPLHPPFQLVCITQHCVCQPVYLEGAIKDLHVQ